MLERVLFSTRICIVLFQIGNPINRTDKRIIWIDGGIHAREWAAVHTALYFIDQVSVSQLFDSEFLVKKKKKEKQWKQQQLSNSNCSQL